MIDHLFGRPNPSWKRAQVFIVIFFWLWRILKGTSGPPRILWLNRFNRMLQRFTPWQIIVSTLTTVYTIRNFDKILGLQSPEPLANLYSPSYYRATWITTGLDTGFATAMSIKPKWLRDICSVLFAGYYILYPNEADEKLRRFRAVPTVEMLRTTWEKTTNPYIRAFSPLPSVNIRRKILLARPKSSSYHRPLTVYLFYAGTPSQLRQSNELILDIPGGGFIAMSPEHHEDRLRIWARTAKRPILSLDYGKAPEYPYPFAIDEAFDLYRLLVESGGSIIGMSGKNLKVIMTGDSAGACIGVNVVFKILEQPMNGSKHALPKPHAMALSYAALDFNFTSWMTPDNLRVLTSEQSSGSLKELAKQKDHLKSVSPLSMTGERPGHKKLKHKTSWKESLRGLSGNDEEDSTPDAKSLRRSKSGYRIPVSKGSFFRPRSNTLGTTDDSSDSEEEFEPRRAEDTPLECRVKDDYFAPTVSVFEDDDPEHAHEQGILSAAVTAANNQASLPPRTSSHQPLGTRVTMASRTGYFTDRIIAPTMMRAMAILYIGPHHDPDFATDYRISPVLAPSHLLAQFPPLLMQCGEKDPFVDDTVVFAGRVREAKRARKVELDLALSGKSARFGESLRISGTEAPTDNRKSSMRRERDRLALETEDDWAQIVIFSEWSHGYLQMPLIMPEAVTVIEELAEWMDDAFSRFLEPGHQRSPSNKPSTLPNSRQNSGPAVQKSKPQPSPYTTETETDDGGITFVPKRYQKTSPTSSGDDKAGSTARNSPISDGVAHVQPTESSETGQHDSDPDYSLGVMLGLIDGYEVPSNQADGQKPSGPRQTGITISETELMRRRRLLDSHLNTSISSR
ncbi:Alpha/Beta hydrolase protein [Mucidula mucida]|nr:Alpha/Beta hydrolase protein [Mucidula mucida]